MVVIRNAMDIVVVAIVLATVIQVVIVTLRNLDTPLVLVILLAIVNHVVAMEVVTLVIHAFVINSVMEIHLVLVIVIRYVIVTGVTI